MSIYLIKKNVKKINNIKKKKKIIYKKEEENFWLENGCPEAWGGL